MSSVPKEHDYIGLSGTSMERISDKLSSSSSSSSSTATTTTNAAPADEENINKVETCLNLKETELRLGLPGSHSPERKPLSSLSSGVSLFGKDIDTTTTTSNNITVNNSNGYSCSLNGPLKNLVSGAKRGFSDAIADGSSAGNWIFSVTNGSDVDLSNKGAALFSSRSENCCNNNSNINNPTQKSFLPVGLANTDGIIAAGGGVIPQSSKPLTEKNSQVSGANENTSPPAAKAQVVGWPPIRSFRKNTMASNVAKNNEDAEAKSGTRCLYVKVSMDGAPYLRKVDLKTYTNYAQLSSGLEKMFRCFTIGQCGSDGLPGRDGLSETCLKDLLHGSEYVLTYEDKDGDWMLVGDVPWEMFTDTCRRLRIMKGSEAIGLAPRAMEKCKSRN